MSKALMIVVLLCSTTVLWSQVPSLILQGHTSEPGIQKRNGHRLQLDLSVLEALKRDALDGVSINLKGQEHTFYGRYTEEQNGLTIWQGRALDGDLILTIGDDHLYGRCGVGDATFILQPAGSKGSVEIFERDPALELPSPNCGVPIPVNDDLRAWSKAREEPLSRLDVMIFYHSELVTLYGDTLMTRLQHFVSLTNAAFNASGVEAYVNLVHVEARDFADETVIPTLEALQQNEDVFAGSEDLRTTYGADQVTYIRPRVADACGAGYILPGAFPTHAYSVVEVQDGPGPYCSEYSFAHELGHNLGAAHDINNVDNEGRDPFSHGYQEPEGQFRTIMAYVNGCQGDCPRIGHFSNPDVAHEGLPTGTAEANNVETFRTSVGEMANFRDATQCAPPIVVAQGESMTVCEGDSALFQVQAGGTDLSYQWYFEGFPIHGQTQPELVIDGVGSSVQGTFHCVVTGACGNVSTTPVRLELAPPLSVLSQPVSTELCLHDRLELSFTSTGFDLRYQWFKDGTPLESAQGPSLIVEDVGLAETGVYECVVSDACGDEISSESVAVTVNDYACTYYQTLPAGYEAWQGGQDVFMCDVPRPGILTYVAFVSNLNACPE